MKKIKESLGKLSDKVTTADAIPIPQTSYNFTQMRYEGVKGNLTGFETTDKETIKWITGIKAYCEKEGITPEDLILSHKEGRKSKKGTKTPKNEESAANQSASTKNDRSNFMQDLKFKKTGIK